MKKVNFILSGLPIFILSYWVICLVFLIKNTAYTSRFYELDNIDSVIVGVSCIHAFFYWFDYKKISKYCLRAVIFIIILTFFEPYINYDFYNFLYFFVVTMTVLYSINANIYES